MFEPRLVAQLARKCREHDGGQFSNSDNMALVGILSTHLLHDKLVRAPPAARPPPPFRTVVDRLGETS